ncbi:MAG: hypothetical protein QXU18_14880 [Thermoplasmatales archaeon]
MKCYLVTFSHFRDPQVSVNIDKIVIISKRKKYLSLGRKLMLEEKNKKIRNPRKLSKRKEPVLVSPEIE